MKSLRMDLMLISKKENIFKQKGLSLSTLNDQPTEQSTTPRLYESKFSSNKNNKKACQESPMEVLSENPKCSFFQKNSNVARVEKSVERPKSVQPSDIICNLSQKENNYPLSLLFNNFEHSAFGQDSKYATR